MISSLGHETARITELIRNEQLGEVESVWAEALEKAPDEVDTFLSLADRLAKAGYGEKAGTLLEQVVNRLHDMGKAIQAVHVLGELARVAPRNSNQRALAEVVFGSAFQDLAGYEKCVDRAEEESNGGHNRFVKSLYSQLQFQPGDWVYHDAGWGLGQVKAIDAENCELKIDFENKEDHKVKLGAAAKYFRKLPENDIQVQRAADIEGLKARCESDPDAVILSILKSHNNKSNLKRVKAELVPQVIDARSWTKWWNNVRTLLAQHHYVKLGTSGNNPAIERLVTAMTPEDETRERFDATPLLQNKLAAVRAYVKDSQEGEVRAALLQHFADELKKFVERDAELDQRTKEGMTLAAERILVHFLVHDLKAKEPSVEVELGYDADELMRDSDALLGRLEEISDTDFQWRALERHAELNEAVWAKTYSAAMLKHVPLLWDKIYKRLHENGHNKELLGAVNTIFNESDQYPLQTLWLARRSILKDNLPEGFAEVPANEMFSRLLWTINKVLTRIERGEESLKDTLASLRAAMTERNSRLLTTALQGLSDDRASHLMHEIQRCRGLSDIHLGTLRDVVLKAFPKVQAKLAQQAAELADEEGEGMILATERGLRKRQAELKRIQEVELPEVGKQIGEALAMGDISENAELDAAREKESRLKEQAREIMEELKRVRVVPPEEVDDTKAGFGTRVGLRRDDGKTREYTILGRYEADLEQMIISNESPIAQGILGRAPGEKAVVETPDGTVNYEVISVERAE
jgi:transcription elongation factor GreA